MDIRQLHYFLTLCEEMNYTRAAQRLFLSRQALRQSISALEAEMCGPLFISAHHKLALTDRGMSFQRHAAPRAPRRESELREPPREEFIRPPRRQEKKAVRPRVRERQRVSGVLALGFAALAAMVVVVLMSYAQLTSISADVVSMQKELKTLDAEHVALLTQYERTFDLETVKAAAVAAGMNKPSSSQINYIDLSAPDSVELCEAQNVSVLSRVFTSLGQGVFSVVEYFS